MLRGAHSVRDTGGQPRVRCSNALSPATSLMAHPTVHSAETVICQPPWAMHTAHTMQWARRCVHTLFRVLSLPEACIHLFHRRASSLNTTMRECLTAALILMAFGQPSPGLYRIFFTSRMESCFFAVLRI